MGRRGVGGGGAKGGGGDKQRRNQPREDTDGSKRGRRMGIVHNSRYHAIWVAVRMRSKLGVAFGKSPTLDLLDGFSSRGSLRGVF